MGCGSDFALLLTHSAELINGVFPPVNGLRAKRVVAGNKSCHLNWGPYEKTDPASFDRPGGSDRLRPPLRSAAEQWDEGHHQQQASPGERDLLFQGCPRPGEGGAGG